MNPAKRKKLHRLSLAAEKVEVKAEEVKPAEVKVEPVVVASAPVLAEPVVEATLPQEAPVVEVPKAAPVSKKNKKLVETEE